MSRRERFIELVAGRPEGAKVNIPAIVRVLTPTQMQIVAAIERLIADGDLDAETLRRPIETPVQLPEAELAEPPEQVAVAKGGGDDARNQQSSPPIDLDRLFACFGLEFETLKIVAQRFGASSPQKIVRHTRTLHERGLVEQSPPANGQSFCLWRRLEQNTQGAPGTARKAPGAEESTSAKRIEDRAPIEEPASPPRAAPAHPVDIKVNEMPARPTGKDLAERLDVWSKETGGSLVRLGLHLFNSQAGIRTLRDVRQPKRATVERVLAFLADPLPPDKLPLRVKPVRAPTINPHRPAVTDQVTTARLVQASHRRNREAARLALDAGETKGQNAAISGAMKALRESDEVQARLADPVEQAKLIIRRKGLQCFDASVHDGERKGRGFFYIGRHRVSEDELFAFAKRLAA